MPDHDPNNLYLIGYRGSGKSTVAPLIASRLQLEFVDTDTMAENIVGLSVAEIFSQLGEAEFRRAEAESVVIASSFSDQVVSLGGGAPLLAASRSIMKATGRIVWLDASAEILWQRISADSRSESLRPALTEQGGFAEVESVLEARRPIYAECADFTVDVGSRSPQEVAERIVAWWQSVDVTDSQK